MGGKDNLFLRKCLESDFLLEERWGKELKKMNWVNLTEEIFINLTVIKHDKISSIF